MRLEDKNIDFTTLTWVKPELDETLRQARNALQNYVEEGESPAELRTCAELLHQVQGTLRMVELYGASMVAEEMEQLARALIGAKVANRDAAYASLMQGIVQLPDYLERLQSGHRDIPIVLLPLLNQLRESRGEKGLNESVLFSPDLSRPLPPSAAGPQVPLEPAELTRRAETLRGLFQGALLRWLKEDNSPATIRDLTDVCEQLVPITWAEPARRLFWVAAGTLDALAKNAFPISNPLKHALAKVEREIKRLAEGGDAAFRANPPIELTKQLLYFVAHEGSDTGRIGEIRHVFGLSGTEPSEAELAHARGSLSGSNRALLETVAVAIKEDLLRVKDALDLHLRTPGASVAELGAQVEALDRVADTLGMLGLGVPRRVVQDQRTAINDVISGQRKGDEETLLDIAGALLYVEAALDDQVERLGKEDTQPSETTETVATGSSSESRRLLEVLVKEAIVNFSDARQSFVAFVETHWDHSQLAEVPRLLTEVAGALRILNINEPADYLTGIRQFTENELLRRKQVPNGQQMDRLADALASLEYFLEALRDRRPNREQILEVARQSLASLGYWPLVAETAAAAAAPPAKAAPAPAAPPLKAAPAAEAAPPTPAPTPTPVPPPVAVEPPAPTPPPVAVEPPAPTLPPVEVEPPAPTPPPAVPPAPVREVAAPAEIPKPVAERPGPVFVPPAPEVTAPAPSAPPPAPAAKPAAPAPITAAPTPAPAVAAIGALVPGFDGSSSEEIDDEIREVFLEEFEEEIENLTQLLPAWRHDPANAELLRPIRRVFHTLKGSGRLVGAKTLGEFSWKIESLLNRVLDGSRPPSPQVLAMVQVALDHLPLLRTALQGQAVHADLDGIQAVAEQLTAGEEVSYSAAATAAVAPEVEIEMVDRDVEMAPEAQQEPVVEAAAEAAGIDELETGAFSIDPVLLEILKPEVAGHLEVVDAWLAQCAARGPQPVTDPLLRSIHTMNGAFAMTDVVMITDVTAPLEGYVKRALAHQRTPGADAVAVVADAVKAIRATIAAIEKPRPVLPQFDELSARVFALRDSLPDSILSSVPSHAEEDTTAVMPQVVVMEEADVSAIPQFETAPEPVAEEAAPAEEAAVEASPVEEKAPVEIFEGVDLDLGELAEAQFEEQAVVSEPEAEAAAGEMEPELVETPSAFVHVPAESEIEASAIEASFEVEEPSVFEMEAAEFEQAMREEPALDTDALATTEEAVSFTFEEEASAPEAEMVDFAAASETEAASSMPVEEYAAVEPAAFEQEISTEAAAPSVEPEAEAAPEVLEHAEIPESEMLSLEAFLRQAGEPPAAFVVDEAPEPEEFAMEIEEETPSEAPPTAEPEAPALEIHEAAAADEKLDISELSDAALASMIAAYPVDEETEVAAPEAEEEAPTLAPLAFEESIEWSAPTPVETSAAEPEISAQPEVETSIFSTDELAGADSLLGEAAPFETADVGAGETMEAPVEAVPEPKSEEATEEYYGLSLAELEAMTAPEAETPAAATSEAAAAEAPPAAEPEAMAEADGFADLPMISELPAWAGVGEAATTLEAAAEPAAAETSEAEETASDEAELATSEAESETVRAADDDRPADEMVTTPTDEVELVAEAEAVAQEAVEEALVEDELIEDELIEDELIEDELIEDEKPAAVVVPVAAEPVRAPRPAVPLAHDEPDPEEDLDVSDLDTELLDLFLEETGDILDHSDGMLARLRDHVDDRDSIVNLQRDLHTLKGGARMAGIYAVGDLGHAMESLLEAVAEGRQKLDATGVVILERGFDRLHAMVGRIGARKAISLPAGLIAQVEALSEGKSLRELEFGEAAAGAVEAVPQYAATAEAPALNPLSAPVEEMAQDDELSSVRAPQEQVRIRADLLDRLVNYAGEVAIYRARLEQQLGAFRANLGELDQTTTRLREQLRRLDIETEAQIIARYQREGEDADERFDPLELDRFTNQQQLTRGLNESANDLVNLQGVLDELTRQYETLLLQQSRVSSDLQEGLMRTRMVPFDALVPRLRRVLRQAAIDTGKQVQLKVDGASGEMDRNVLDHMTAPLEHMLRNSMAHGLESPEERRKAKKPEEGTVRITVLREGSEVVLKVTDDGRGLNRDAIRKKAIEKGIIAADAEMSDDAIYALILEGGFSTAETVTRISGRGVGMDVVYNEIRQLGGTLQIKSEPGKGSEFTIRLPFTLAVTQAVFVKIGDTSFAVPIASVRGVGRIARADLEKQLKSEHPVFNYAGEDYAIHDLGTLIGHAPAKAQDSLQMPLLLARSGDLRTAISIDQVLGSREIVVKPVGPQVNSVPGIFGATIMGDGRVVVILDVAPLVRRHMAVVRDETPVVAAPVVVAHRVPVVMVVDDSITMRKVTGRVLERNNMEVLTAKDGVDAVEKMAERVPDLVLLDIEMPRMDGYEVAQNMRSDPRLKDVPIIMITSRTGEKHRQRAMDIGVDRYLGKPYQELELMRNVFEVLGMEAVND